MFNNKQDAFDAFEIFMLDHFDRKIDELEQFKRKKLGHYFSELDNYFAIWHKCYELKQDN